MNKKIKYIGIVTFSAVLCIFLHLITPPALTSETPENTLSELALLLGFPLTAVLWAGIAYSCVAFVFYLIEDRIPGEKGARGKDLTDTSNTFNKNQSFIGIVIFVLVFSIARTGSYYMNIIDTGFQVNTVYTLVWTIVMGFCLGILYMLLGKTITSSSALVSAIKFGFLLFGLTWGIFIMFFPLMLKGQLINTILMFLIDTLSVTAAYYFSEILLNRSQGVNHKY